MVYPALLPLIRTSRLPVVELSDAPSDLNGLIRFAEKIWFLRVCHHISNAIYLLLEDQRNVLQFRAALVSLLPMAAVSY